MIRGAIGMSTCLKGFQERQVRIYLIVRLVWDCVLVLFNLVMASLLKITMRTFILQLVVLVILDGYMNLVVYSYLRAQSEPREEQEESIEDKVEDAKAYNINININLHSVEAAPEE